MDVDEFRACARSFLRDHEALLLERNSMIFELDTAKTSSAREASRKALLERENNHLKLELGSKLASLGNSMKGIVGHFEASEVLGEARADLARLGQKIDQQAREAALAAREEAALRAQLRSEQEAREAEDARHGREARDLRLAVKREAEKWRGKVAEAGVVCRGLQDKIDELVAAKRRLESRGGESWEQRAGALKAENESLREEIGEIREKLARVQAAPNKSNKSNKPRPRKRAKVATK